MCYNGSTPSTMRSGLLPALAYSNLPAPFLPLTNKKVPRTATWAWDNGTSEQYALFPPSVMVKATRLRVSDLVRYTIRFFDLVFSHGSSRCRCIMSTRICDIDMRRGILCAWLTSDHFHAASCMLSDHGGDVMKPKLPRARDAPSVLSIRMANLYRLEP